MLLVAHLSGRRQFHARTPIPTTSVTPNVGFTALNCRFKNTGRAGKQLPEGTDREQAGRAAGRMVESRGPVPPASGINLHPGLTCSRAVCGLIQPAIAHSFDKSIDKHSRAECAYIATQSGGEHKFHNDVVNDNRYDNYEPICFKVV